MYHILHLKKFDISLLNMAILNLTICIPKFVMIKLMIYGTYIELPMTKWNKLITSIHKEGHI